MATLNEQVNEIMSESSSKAVKREKLLKIGVSISSIEHLFWVDKQAKKRARREQGDTQPRPRSPRIFNKYTFGVEIECYNASVGNLVSIAQSKGLAMQYEHYNHENRPHYKLTTDGSIQGNNAVECVTPVLKGQKGLNSLKVCCDSLNEVGAMVNKTTGLHVHVGGRITEQQYCNVFANYYRLESVIDKFMAPSRTDNRYAKTLRNCPGLVWCTTYDNVRNELNRSRYYKVNCMAMNAHGTIEFRQHQGTTDFQKIAMWVRFCVKLVDWSATHKLTHNVTSVADIEFLNAEEKAFFTERTNHFSNN